MVAKTVSNAPDPGRDEARSGILARINSREQEIETLLREAREAAAATLHEARRRERSILAACRQEADREASRVSATILAEARRTAGEISSEGARQAELIRTVPRERIEQTAERLLAILLPPGPPETTAR